MNIYQKWGFNKNPFEVTELSSNENDSKLFVGREKELNSFIRRICNPPKCITIEGENGVGKTSLINIGFFEIEKLFQKKELRQLYYPCKQKFQLSQEVDSEDFIDEVFYEIAQTFILNSVELGKRGVALPQKDAIDDFLNTYELASMQAGVGVFSLGESIELNSSQAFNRSGFRQLVNIWLSNLSEHHLGGGVICVLDNLELLKTSKNAKKRFEYLRDKLFNLSGLRWVLSGSSGIIHGVATSPRLSGILYSPIIIEGLKIELSEKLFNTRINLNQATHNYYLPIDSNGFRNLLSILGGNIRHALSYTDEYCMWCIDENITPKTDLEKKENLNRYLMYFSYRLLDAFESQVSQRGRTFFKDAGKRRSKFSFSDFKDFNFRSISEMRLHVNQLEDIELLQRVKHDSNLSKISICLTPKGVLLYEIQLA